MTAEQFQILSSQNTEIATRLTTLEVQLRPLFDNGQPGLLTKMDGRLVVLESVHNQQLGEKAVKTSNRAEWVAWATLLFSGFVEFWRVKVGR